VNKRNVYKTLIILYLSFYLVFSIIKFLDINTILASIIYSYSNNWGIGNYDTIRIFCYGLLLINIIIIIVILNFVFINRNAFWFILFFSFFHTIILIVHLVFLTNKYLQDIIFSLIISLYIVPLIFLYISFLNISKRYKG
jgi:hypothetical protein